MLDNSCDPELVGRVTGSKSPQTSGIFVVRPLKHGDQRMQISGERRHDRNVALAKSTGSRRHPVMLLLSALRICNLPFPLPEAILGQASLVGLLNLRQACSKFMNI